MWFRVRVRGGDNFLSDYLISSAPQLRCLEERDPLPVAALLVQEFLAEEEKEGGGSGWKLPAEDEASFDRPALGRCGIDLKREMLHLRLSIASAGFSCSSAGPFVSLRLCSTPFPFALSPFSCIFCKIILSISSISCLCRNRQRAPYGQVPLSSSLRQNFVLYFRFCAAAGKGLRKALSCACGISCLPCLSCPFNSFLCPSCIFSLCTLSSRSCICLLCLGNPLQMAGGCWQRNEGLLLLCSRVDVSNSPDVEVVSRVRRTTGWRPLKSLFPLTCRSSSLGKMQLMRLSLGTPCLPLAALLD